LESATSGGLQNILGGSILTAFAEVNQYFRQNYKPILGHMAMALYGQSP
jgi:hypothetical protein